MLKSITIERVREGAKVVAADIAVEAARKTVDEINGWGFEAIAIKVDVRRVDEVAQMVKATLDKFGQIDILVNVVGGAIPEKVGPFCQSSEETWHEIFDSNLFGTFNCCRTVINHMIERQSVGLTCPAPILPY